MADTSVFINGAAEGAFTDALNGLPPWATESTAVTIEGILNKSLSTQNKMLQELVKKATGGGSPDVSKTNDELDKYLKNLKDLNKQAEKDKATADKRAKVEKDSDTRAGKRKTSSLVLEKVLGGLISAGSKVIASQKQYFETSNDLFKSGVNLLTANDTTSSSMESLNQMVILTGLRLETLQKVIEKYASSINAVGITKFTKTIALTNQRMIALGYSSEQQAELIGTLIESESSYADIRSKSADQIANDAVRLGAQLNKLSLTTGQSNEKLQENLRALAKNNDSTVVAAQYGAEAAERMNEFAASFKDQDVGNMMQRLGASITPEITKTFQDLVKAGEGPLAQEFTRIARAARDGTIDAATANRQTTELAQRINSSTLANLSLFTDASVEGANETLTVLTKLRAQGNTTSKATDKQTDAAVKSQAALAGFSTALERTKSLTQAAFPLLEDQVNIATGVMKLFNSAALTAIDSMSATTRSWIGVGVEVAALTLATAASVGGIKNMASIVSGLVPTLARFGMGLGVAAAGAFAAYEVFNLIKALKDKSDAKDKLADSRKGLSATEARINALSPADRARFDAMGGNVGPQTSATSISIPKNPMQSTISSPSAVAVAPTAPPGDISAPAAQSPNQSVGSGIEKPPRTSDINSLLTYQNSISEQLLLSMQKLVSVNGEILQVSRTH